MTRRQRRALLRLSASGHRPKGVTVARVSALLAGGLAERRSGKLLRTLRGVMEARR